MKFNKIFLIIFIIASAFLCISSVCASDAVADNLTESSDNHLGGVEKTVYVDAINGDDSNDGSTKDSSLKSVKTALELSKDNYTINIAGGTYKELSNTRLTIDKSVNLVGSDNTVFDGENKNYIFIVSDNVKVTFKNINFINAYKSPTSYSNSFNDNLYGAALEIKNADVTIDNCQFIGSVLDCGANDKYIYGGAVSNFGDLTIKNSYFNNNLALSDKGLYSYGGCVYNKGKLSVKNSKFENSRSVDFGYGAGIANDGELMMQNSIIKGSRALHECKGSAIYNTGDFILLDSVIENNYIEGANFNCIYGAVYNSGNFKARGNIFRNNTGNYEPNMLSYKGSPNIYNVGILNLTYNAFIDNSIYDGISRDVYFNGGEVITLDNNWWNTNENPYDDSGINIDQVNLWLTFNLHPEYSKLDIGKSAEIIASWSNNINQIPQINHFPIFNVTFSTSYGKKLQKQLINGEASFIFDYSQNKGSFQVYAGVESFSQNMTVDVGKIYTSLDVENNENITFRDALEVKIAVASEGSSTPTGVVSLYIDDNCYKLNLNKGTASTEIKGLIPGNHDLKVVYEGDNDHFRAFYNKTIVINKESVDLSVIIPEIKIDKKGSAIVSLLPEGIRGLAILYIDGVAKKNVYLYSGNTTISLNNFGEGEYNITFGFVETSYYKAANASAILKVTKYDSSLTVSADDIQVGQNATILINVTPNTLRGEAILTINGVNTTIYLNNDTTAVNLHSLQAGIYDVSVLFEGDAKYSASNASTSFSVSRQKTTLDVMIDEDEKNLNGTVTIGVSPSNCTGVVGLYINYNQYTANITNGKVKFNVKFDKGTNYIFAYYEGNEYYSDATWNTTIGVADEFVFIGQNSTGWNYNNFNYSVRLLEVTGIPMPNRVVGIEFKGNKYNITTNDDGYGYFPLNLPTGSYSIKATYKNATIENSLSVKDITFNLTTIDIVYGELEKITANFDKGVGGYVRVVIDGILNKTVEIINNTAVYNASGLKVGSYAVKIIYFNDKFASDELSSSFSVSKANLILDIIADDCTPDCNQIIKVLNLKDATGNLNIKVNEKEYVKEIKDSEVILNLSKLATGKYSLTVTYLGDDNYLDSISTAVFYIKDGSSDIILNVNDADYGENIIAVATLNKNATGIVRFSAGNLTREIEIIDGVATWIFKGLDVGSYDISANYLGDNYYISSTNSTSFAVSKAKSEIFITVNEVLLNENIRIYANLSPNATGKVIFSMIGYYSPRSKNIIDSKSMWYISPLQTGEYTVIARYDGDKNYFASNTTYELKVSQKRAILNVEIDDASLKDRVIAKISLKSGDGELISDRISLKIGEKSYSIMVNNGKSSFVIGKLAEGNYTYQASYDGNENYSKSSCEGRFIVRDTLLNVSLTAADLVKYYKGSEQLTVKLLSESGKAISGETIIVKIKGKEYLAITDSKGMAYIDIGLASGNYVALIYFNETSRYHSASTNASINISKTVEGIDVIKLFGSGTQYFAIFCDSEGNALGNARVTFKIGSRSFTTTTLPNGISRLNINFNPGNYKIQATNPVTGEKAYNNILIFKRLAGNKNIVQYYGAGKYYKVRAYGDKGKAVGAGVIVKIRVNGKTYNVKTNKKGYALFKINLKPKKYTIAATYKGYKVSNKIYVKSTIITKNLSKKKSSTARFNAKLVNKNGKILKGKKIAFKFKGKTYVVKTNRKGIAGIPIKSSLNVGKHKIITRYGKLKVTNTIVVRR